MAKVEDKRTDPAVFTLLFLTVVLLGVRFYASKIVGWGDSEALYASYAKFPQVAYLDHPGLVGMFASSLGGGSIPQAAAAHVATACLASMFPWLVVIVARRLGAETRPAAIAGIVVAAVPEFGVGLFAMTPDLLLAYAWLAFLGTVTLALDGEPSATRTTMLFAAAGLIAGVAATAKVTGVFLLFVLAIVAWKTPHRKSPWPWLGALVACVPIGVVARFEIALGFPMLRHRFVDTQHGAGLSLRNVGALFGGQLVYLSPFVAIVAVIVARDLIKRRNDDVASRVLFWSFALPIAPLVILCLWSKVAEPHWIAPPLLALPIHAARRSLAISRKLVGASIALGLAMIGAVYAWVLDPDLLRYAPASYDPKVDIANELFGWPQATRVAGEMIDESVGAKLDAWVVGPSWMICAQLQAGLPGANVGCATDVRSDFDDWAPRARWERADVIVFVTDERMPVDPETLIPAFHVERSERVTMLRGGRIVRTFRLSYLEKRAGA